MKRTAFLWGRSKQDSLENRRDLHQFHPSDPSLPHLWITISASFLHSSGGLTAALLFGLIARKLHLSPLVGYLLAGVVVGPYSPGFVADSHTVEQFAELGVILLMFGVGLHFHLKDLIAVQKVAVPGAVVQISVATVLGVIVGWCFGWSTISGLVFGMAISVASTVVLTRVLEDHQNLHTPSGHVALGWLVVEDLFTILLLVLIPAVMEARQSGAGGWDSILSELGWMFVKLSVLVALTLFAGKKIIPLVLRYVARTGARDLFTLAVLVIALGGGGMFRRIFRGIHGAGRIFGGHGCRPVGLLRARRGGGHADEGRFRRSFLRLRRDDV